MPERTRRQQRPTAKSHLILAWIVSLASAISAGFAVGLAGARHALLDYAAHARQVHERALASGFGVALTSVGAGCSGWFLAALIGGAAALADYQFDYIEPLKAAAEIVGVNASVDATFLVTLT